MWKNIKINAAKALVAALAMQSCAPIPAMAQTEYVSDIDLGESDGIVREVYEENDVPVATPSNFSYEEPGLKSVGFKAQKISNTKKLKTASRLGLSMPSAYSSAEHGYISPVKDQGDHNTCWAFASVNSAEASAAISENADLDLSESHLGYFFYNREEDPLGLTEGDKNTGNKGWYDTGGSIILATMHISGGTDMASEEQFVYDGGPEKPEDIAAEDAYGNNVVVLKNAWFYNIADTSHIKKAIMNHGSVAAGYYEPFNSSYMHRVADGKYDGEWCFYNPAKPQKSANHAISIIGWDDDFPADAFGNETMRPNSNGAWLVKSSYGADWPEENAGGFYWISYEEVTLGDELVAAEYMNANYYDHLYYYDGSASIETKEISAGTKTANIYRSQQDEVLKAVNVGVYSVSTPFTVQVYKNTNEMASPEDGVPAFEEPVEFTTSASGLYTVDVPEIEIREGEYFSVVLDYKKNAEVFVGHSKRYGSWYNATEVTAAGESFYTSKGSWKDANTEKTAFRIKAMTKDAVLKGEQEAPTFNAGRANQLPVHEHEELLEYRPNGTQDWLPYDSDAILDAGLYMVRYAETDTLNASEMVAVEIRNATVYVDSYINGLPVHETFEQKKGTVFNRTGEGWHSDYTLLGYTFVKNGQPVGEKTMQPLITEDITYLRAYWEPNKTKGKLQIEVPDSVYGESYEAVVTSDYETYVISYMKGNNLLDVKPVDAGTYTAYISAFETDKLLGTDAYTTFTISPKPVTYDIKYKEKVYDGTEEMSVAAENLPDGVSFTYDVSYDSVMPGKRKVTISNIAFNSDNYKAENKIFDVTILKTAGKPTGSLTKTDETYPGKNDGKIAGITEEMEYSADSVWTPCSGTAIEGLAAGTYKIRYRETDISEAGPETIVIIKNTYDKNPEEANNPQGENAGGNSQSQQNEGATSGTQTNTGSNTNANTGSGSSGGGRSSGGSSGGGGSAGGGSSGGGGASGGPGGSGTKTSQASSRTSDILTSKDGSWKETAGKWTFVYQNGAKATGWKWIDGNGDGIAECYCFGTDGVMYANTTTPDGYTVNESGAWTLNGAIQTRPAGNTGSQTDANTGISGAFVKGTWQNTDGKWTFKDESGVQYKERWGYIHNPYASGTQDKADWFYFDKDGFMVTGWYEDPATKDKYYLNPVSDGTKGKMVAGEYIVDGVKHYFNPNPDGTRGKMMY